MVGRGAEKVLGCITKDWLCIWSYSCCKFGPTAGATLAKPLLWACFDGAAVDMVPPGLKGQILYRYQLLEGQMEDEEVNPIQKIPSTEAGIARGARGGHGEKWKNIIYAKMCTTCTTQNHVSEIRNHNIAEMAEMNKADDKEGWSTEGQILYRYVLNEIEKRRKEQQLKDLEIELLKTYQQQDGKHTTQDDEDKESKRERRQKEMEQCDLIETLDKDDEDYKYYIECMKCLQK
eukprot:jgi/Psemu1/54060/gm1.54060_g